MSNSTTPSSAPLSVDDRIERRFYDCVHCGLCLAQCPTYAEIGDENDSPRGRIYLMKSLTDGSMTPSPTVLKHLDLCLDCRACETACPSGVRYGSLIETIRGEVNRRGLTPKKGFVDMLLDHVMYDIMPYPKKLKKWVALGRLAQAVGVNEFLETSGLTKWIPTPLVKLQNMLPPENGLGGGESIPQHAKPAGPVRAKVALFTGCVNEALFKQTNQATHRVLLANGCEVFAPRSQVCCGAIHHHGGREEFAQRLARANIDAFKAIDEDLDAVIVNVAGCGAMLKDYEELLIHDTAYAEPAARFIAKTKDICEFLSDLPLRRPTRALNMKVTYHDPCHLAHGQQIRYQPREILRMIPGLQLVDLVESDWCCGAAGTYNLTQPEMSAKLAKRKLDHIDNTGADVIATGNAGCLLQLMQHAGVRPKRYRIAHPIDLLDEAYA
jgi:glycolate oxidase iron-sulfur subunit